MEFLRNENILEIKYTFWVHFISANCLTKQINLQWQKYCITMLSVLIEKFPEITFSPLKSRLSFIHSRRAMKQMHRESASITNCTF